ncbi:MAG: cyclic nucleotide-binding domain-containing protein [Bryobacteraceae bacterium]
MPIEALQRVPLFADLNLRELRQLARLFKERSFSAGEAAIQEGSGGAAFFVIQSGEAEVIIHGRKKATLKAGEFFGEIALIDDGPRMASIIAATDMVCYGLTYWDFRPVVKANGVLGWKLLQQMAKLLRVTRQELFQ